MARGPNSSLVKLTNRFVISKMEMALFPLDEKKKMEMALFPLDEKKKNGDGSISVG